MPQSPITFRCAGRSDRSEMHVVRVERGRAICSCQGVDWCSHIDAVLNAGERFMVPEADRPAADRAQRALRGILHAPEGWQASWRDDRVWRGLAPPRNGDVERAKWDGRPTVCFIGSGPAGNRAEYVDHAASLGWRIVENPAILTTLVVASPDSLGTKRGTAAIAFALPVITHEQWDEWCYEMSHAIHDRIEEHGRDPAGGRKAA